MSFSLLRKIKKEDEEVKTIFCILVSHCHLHKNSHQNKPTKINTPPERLKELNGGKNLIHSYTAIFSMIRVEGRITEYITVFSYPEIKVCLENFQKQEKIIKVRKASCANGKAETVRANFRLH